MAASKQDTAENGLSLVFSYGTLKRGFQNHVLMEELKATGDARFKGEYTTMEAFPLVIGPYGIPFLINKPGSGHPILGELYAVTGRGLARLDELEGIETGHYERLPVKVVADGGEVVPVEAYFAHRSFAEALWRKCGEVGMNEYAMEMGNEYVKRSNRPLGSTFVGYCRREFLVTAYASRIELQVRELMNPLSLTLMGRRREPPEMLLGTLQLTKLFHYTRILQIGGHC